MNIVLHISYDGTRFVGWQKTNLDPKRFPSIQYVLESVISQILRHPVELQAASRTDRGVHAAGQVVNFHTSLSELNLERFLYSLNCLLPEDIRAQAALVAEESFHPTLSNTAKEYHYRIAYGKILSPFLRFTHWHFPYALNSDSMRKAAIFLIGTHDFRAFRNHRKGLDENDTVRHILAIDVEDGPDQTLCIKMTGNNFLYKMARNIAGTLAYVGCGKLQEGQVKDLVAGASRPDAGVTAPACGLTLYRVMY